MDFSEIGVKSRKTGLKARDNVKRDQHNMEDLDDFFKDDERTFVGNTTTDKTSESSTSNNGRNLFSNVESSNPGSRKRTPLLSPLPSRTNFTDDAEEQYASAMENPIGATSSQDMEIEEPTPGRIKLVNHFADIQDIRNISHQTPKPSRGRKLFVSSDSDDNDDSARNKTVEERQIELERNTTVRSAARVQSRDSRPSFLQRTPPRFVTSPLKSMSPKLHSPLQPRPASSRSISALSKSIATSKIGRSSAHLQLQENHFDNDNDDHDHFDFDNGEDLAKVVESDSESEYDQIRTKARKTTTTSSISRMAPPKKATAKRAQVTKTISAKARRAPLPQRVLSHHSDDDDSEEDDDNNNYNDDSDDEGYGRKRARGRVNKFQRPAPPSAHRSPVRAKEHHIGVERLRTDQESRASSRPPPSGTVTRRSSRVRVPPLAFWRNEKLVYAREKDQQAPQLQEVITVDEPVVQPTRSRAPSRAVSRAVSKTRGRSKARSKSRSRTSRPPSQSRRRFGNITEDEREDDNGEEYDDEENDVANSRVAGSEWFKQGFLKVDAYDGHGSESRSKRLVAWAPGTENFSTEIITAEDNFKLAILFDTNREFIASGMMLIPAGGKKNMKSTDGTYFVFYCIKGVVQVTLSGSVFMIKKGCSLEVPMGNFYEFINKGTKDATLFFVQTKGQEVADWDEDF